MEKEMENGLDVRYLKFIDIDAEVEAKKKAEQEAKAAPARRKPAQNSMAETPKESAAKSSPKAASADQPAAAPAAEAPAQNEQAAATSAEAVQNGPIGEKTMISTKRSSASGSGKRSTSSAGNKKKKKKKRKNRFKKGLKIYVFILVAVILAVVVGLWILMYRYQKNQDAIEAEKEAPQLMFEEWYASRTPQDWAQAWLDDNPGTTETLDTVADYMETVFDDPDIELYRGRDYTEAVPVFTVRNADSELARVTLAKQETEDGYEWTAADITVSGSANTKTLTVPAGCTVTCGGTVLDESSAVPADSLFTDETMADSLENPVSWVTYTVSYISEDPQIEITSDSDYAVYTDEDGQTFFCLEDGHIYQDAADSFVRAYLNYYLQGKVGTYTNMYSALAYVAADSQAYNNLVSSAEGVIWDSYHSGITIETEVGDVIVWADNCYSIDISYTGSGYVGTNSELDEYVATMRVWYTKINGNFCITNYETL